MADGSRKTKPASGHFAERAGLWSRERAEACDRIQRLAKENGLETIRLSFADQHGLLRGKSLMIPGLEDAMREGVNMTTTLLAKDTSHRTVFPVWSEGAGLGISEMTGGGDLLMLPDPDTFRILPWAQKTGWVLCDIYFPDGRPVPFSTRQILKDSLARLGKAGHGFMSGLEVELHLFKLEDRKLEPRFSTQPASPPEVSLLTHGYQYLTETRMDELEPALEIIRADLLALGLPLRSIEVEFGPSQCEFTFAADSGHANADLMVLFRSAMKQICRRHGLHASFMCRPGLPNLFSSGWHLHQSLLDGKTGENLFIGENDSALISQQGHHWAAGLLKHARAASIFTTPTINGYKRLRPYTLAPDRANWAKDNRGAMVRIIGGGTHKATRLENRIGEPAANPYLYMASQVLCGLDGIENRLTPPPPADTPYETEAEPLPRSLMEAVEDFRGSAFFRKALGDRFVDYLAGIKQAEINRFLGDVTDWEQREYFDIF